MSAEHCPTSGKVRHASPQAAHAAIGHQERRENGRRRSSSDGAYKCDACSSWHVRSAGLRPRSAGRPRGGRRR